MSYDNNNRGAIWGNANKETENQPDYKGNLNVDGVEYFVSGWKRKPDANPKAPALSLSLTKKIEGREHGNQPKSADPFAGDGVPDKDIPF